MIFLLLVQLMVCIIKNFKKLINSAFSGKIYLINTSGKTEKVFDAHQGAVLSAKWSSDGSSFVTSKN